MNEAIRLAIEKGGLLAGRKTRVTKNYVFADREDAIKWDRWSFAEIVLMPSFWQALGKALWWEKKGRLNYRRGYVWLYYALSYHEMLLTGGDVEKFWKGLLDSSSNA